MILHLGSHFFYERTISSLTYSAPLPRHWLTRDYISTGPKRPSEAVRESLSKPPASALDVSQKFGNFIVYDRKKFQRYYYAASGLGLLMTILSTRVELKQAQLRRPSPILVSLARHEVFQSLAVH